MNVNLKTKKQILKSLLKSVVSMFPTSLIAIVIYWAILAFIILWVLTDLINVNIEMARLISLPSGAALLFVLGYFYIKWIVKSLSSYLLMVKDEILFVKGRSGWKKLNRKIPVGDILGINLGGYASSLEKVSSRMPGSYAARDGIKDTVVSRLTIELFDGELVVLDSARKAFESGSLNNFLLWLGTKGIKTDIN